MANILNIETSTDVCSVALSSEGGILIHHEDFKGQNHALLLSGFIEDVLKYVASREIKLDAVAISIGPGSYTGLRIGLSEAKGLCFGLGIPLIGIDTLKLLAVSVMFNHEITDDDTLFVPMIDARRMEVFTGVYDIALNEIIKQAPLIIDENAFSDLINTGKKLLFFGNGAEKTYNAIKNDNIKFIPNIKPVALDMIALSEKAFRNNDFIDLAYSTPKYLKEFQATISKKAL
ncbi:MAG: tRNA (adenosine(37)-N6)-threonylcarbamoyltransferase complex dimerization subunit type 1 TsaB [Muribaculaceae bacterium]